jgi:hypothetical protein
MSFESGIRDLWENDYVQKNPTKAYKASYGSEYAAVAAYLNGGAEPNFSGYSRLGKGLCEMEKKRRLDDVVIPPDPIPVPGTLPFAEAVLSSPISVVIPAAQTAFVCEAGKDYLIDLGMSQRTKTFNLTGSARNVQVRNLRVAIGDPYGGSGFQRNGMNVNVLCDHISITNYLTEGTPTQVDNITIACKPTTKVTLQRALCESPKDSQEPNAHCDALQVQGAVGKIEVGLSTFFTAGVRPPNHGGKGFQLDILAALGQTGGPFSVELEKVDFTSLGTSATGARSGIFIGKDDNASIKLSMKEVYGSQDGGNGFDSWLVNYPAALQQTVSGSAPNRVVTFPGNTQGWSGEFRERPAGTHFMTRALLGV